MLPVMIEVLMAVALGGMFVSALVRVVRRRLVVPACGRCGRPVSRAYPRCGHCGADQSDAGRPPG